MKRLFKLFSAGFCLLLSLVMLSACSQGVATTLSGNYFLQNKGQTDLIGNVDETSLYDVSFKASKTSPANGLSVSLNENADSNFYKVRLVNAKYEEIDCYLLETTLKTDLSYKNTDGTVNNAEDTVVSQVYFSSVASKLKPLYSKTTATAHSPILKADGNYEITALNYTYETIYGETDATSKFSHTEGTFDIEDGEKVYKKYYKSSYYFDNATMLFMPRAIKLNDASSLSFYSIDILSGVNRAMSMTSETSENIVFSLNEDEQGAVKHAYYINDRKYFVDGDKQVIKCQVVNFAVSGTFSGTPVKCWYSNTDVENAMARLIKMEVSAPYSLGTFTYVIKNTTTQTKTAG